MSEEGDNKHDRATLSSSLSTRGQESDTMESLGPECTKLKQTYEACFFHWYSEKYLTGKSQEDECAPLFQEYRACLEVRGADETFSGLTRTCVAGAQGKED